MEVQAKNGSEKSKEGGGAGLTPNPCSAARVSRKAKGKEFDTLPRGRRAGRHARASGALWQSAGAAGGAEGHRCARGKGGTEGVWVGAGGRGPARTAGSEPARAGRGPAGMEGQGRRVCQRRARVRESRSKHPGSAEGSAAGSRPSRAGRYLLLLSSAPPRAPAGGGDRWRPGPRAAGTSGSRPSSHPAPHPPAPLLAPTPWPSTSPIPLPGPPGVPDS